MHQPLHVTTRCTPKHLGGDHLGIKFLIDFGTTKNLHQLWDRAMTFIPYDKRVIHFRNQPLTNGGIQLYESFAKNITKQFTRQSLKDDLKEKDQWKMAKKFHEMAIKYAYGGIKEGGKPTKDYLNSRYEICKRQIALAGYRLADYLNEVYYSLIEYENNT